MAEPTVAGGLLVAAASGVLFMIWEERAEELMVQVTLMRSRSS